MLNKRLWWVGVAVVAVMAAGWAPVPKARKAPTAGEELKKLQGKWQRHLCSSNGAPLGRPPRGWEVFEGDRMSCVCHDGVVSVVNVTWAVALRPSKAPRAIDFRSGRGVDIPGIYKLEGDTLTICYSNNVRPRRVRPADFTPRKGVAILVYKRVKPKPTAP